MRNPDNERQVVVALADQGRAEIESRIPGDTLRRLRVHTRVQLGDLNRKVKQLGNDIY